MSVDRTSQVISDFVQEKNGGKKVGSEEDILHGGILDSMQIVELIGLLEREFPVTLDEDDLVESNFQTIGTVVGLVEGKMAK